MNFVIFNDYEQSTLILLNISSNSRLSLAFVVVQRVPPFAYPTPSPLIYHPYLVVYRGIMEDDLLDCYQKAVGVF